MNLKNDDPDAPIIMGNTTTGLYFHLYLNWTNKIRTKQTATCSQAYIEFHPKSAKNADGKITSATFKTDPFKLYFVENTNNEMQTLCMQMRSAVFANSACVFGAFRVNRYFVGKLYSPCLRF